MMRYLGDLVELVVAVATFAAVMFAAAWSPGQQCADGICTAPRQPPALTFAPRVEPAVVRVFDERVAERYCATGTIVARQGGSAWILTANHTFRGGPCLVRIETLDGRSIRGDVVGVDDDHDLALVQIDDPKIEPLEIAAAAPAVGEPVLSYGWGDGKAMVFHGQILKGNVANPWVYASGQVRDGDSGSPLLDGQRQIVCCVWGSANGMRYGCGPGPILRLLRKILPPYGRPGRPMVLVPPPAARSPTTPTTPTTQPSTSAAAPSRPAPAQPSAPPQASLPAPGVSYTPPPTSSSTTTPTSTSSTIPPASQTTTAPAAASTSTSASPDRGLLSAGLAAASTAIATAVPGLLGGALIGGPLGLVAVWLARRAALKIAAKAIPPAAEAVGHVAGQVAGQVGSIIHGDQATASVDSTAATATTATTTRSTTTVVERPVILPAQVRTETVYVRVPEPDPKEEAKRSAERHIAMTDSRAAAFFLYRDQLAASQLSPQSI